MKKEHDNIARFPVERGSNNEATCSESTDPHQEAHAQLSRFLESGGGKEFGLTYRKYMERGNLRPAEDIPGKYILSVERHRAVAGSRYHKGLPMAACNTYMQDLIFDPVAMGLTEIGESNIGCEIDVEALASEHMEDYSPRVTLCSGSSSRKVELLLNGFSFIASSLEEAKSKMETLILELCPDDVFYDLAIDIDERIDHQVKFIDACVEHVLASLESAWNNPDMDDDEY